MTVAALATRANSPTTIEGIGSWRVKECDRIEAMASELSKIGARVEVGSDWIRIHPVNAEVRKSIQSSSKTSNSVRISTYKDHRIAMSLAILSLGEEGIEMEIEDPGCVAKTFPEFFRELDRLTIRDAR
uniref:3-phosphoshikimate 1-carboxyvinyltransferase n=2 Tax=Amorphochlora amoebiformis TaxID=1561963 RepID=A0A7S0H837_9EUKA|mmetsp:Transcript_4988/g.7574  ORF Transcript_4988/g.7574 Transcript_4988/m.7574 type:complete len:129 (+) Transcript_4988:70-456(+)